VIEKNGIFIFSSQFGWKGSSCRPQLQGSAVLFKTATCSGRWWAKSGGTSPRQVRHDSLSDGCVNWHPCCTQQLLTLQGNKDVWIRIALRSSCPDSFGSNTHQVTESRRRTVTEINPLAASTRPSILRFVNCGVSHLCLCAFLTSTLHVINQLQAQSALSPVPTEETPEQVWTSWGRGNRIEPRPFGVAATLMLCFNPLEPDALLNNT
jgi:hypothetical protein